MTLQSMMVLLQLLLRLMLRSAPVGEGGGRVGGWVGGCVYVCVFESVCMCVCVHACMCMYVCVFVSVGMCMHAAQVTRCSSEHGVAGGVRAQLQQHVHCSNVCQCTPHVVVMGRDRLGGGALGVQGFVAEVQSTLIAEQQAASARSCLVHAHA